MAAWTAPRGRMEGPSLRKLTHNFGNIAVQPNPILQSLGAPHVESFNFMLEKGLYTAIKDMAPVEFALPTGARVMLSLHDARINRPAVSAGAVGVKEVRVFPSECRQRGVTYKGQLVAQIIWSLNGIPQSTVEKILGEIPIMVKSKGCNLDGLSPMELVSRGEHEDEFGGYFIIKGHEKIMRMLMSVRRNYPVALQRSTWKARGKLFSETGVLVRCVQEDQTSCDNVLHYVNDGTAKYMFSYRREMFFVPLMMVLKALMDVTDQYIYTQMLAGMEHDKHFESCISEMLRRLHEDGLHNQTDVKNFIGKTFRFKLQTLPEWYTDEEVCDVLIRRSLAIHLKNNSDKFNLVVLMAQKLYSVTSGKARVEGSDSAMMQEVLLGGYIYLQLLKDKLGAWMQSVRYSVMKRAEAVGPSFHLSPEEMKGCVNRSISLEPIFESFLATGNMPVSAHVNIVQMQGLAIMAENLNRMRYCSHFRAVHRGAYFTTMRTTEARQLLPDAWGFICPVHTPDGAPCGLLNHLTSSCVVVNNRGNTKNLPKVLVGLGMIPLHSPTSHEAKDCYPLLLDGRWIGRVPHFTAQHFVDQLRMLKVSEEHDSVPKFLEIVLVPKTERGQFPGVFLFTSEARMMRPVWNLAAGKVEWIGTFEQIFMNICIQPEEASQDGTTTHQELSKAGFLSNLAQLIPMPDYNQSPRNMYQCQMGKQTMGTPCHNWKMQSESKLYRLQTPTSPLFRPTFYDKIGMDEFAMGTNAVVAVVSYTGYDMEDAMVINRSSIQRGLAHGSIHKSEFISLADILHTPYTKSIFQRDPHKPELIKYLDSDGLPYVGSKLTEGNPLYCFFNAEEGHYIVKKYIGKETGYVDNIKICGNNSGNGLMNKISMSMRITRNPAVGDKFASRAGQKGICSQQWPQEDLPFTESGLVPDIIFNPHGFPSRMTIAMMIEMMAGKSGSIHGLVHDASPFRFTEKNTAIDYFGRLLEAAGYDYYGTERMYSGVDGREMEVDIFMGIVHYQRLRHMVSDKWQVRSVGPVDLITQQPIKGRKRGGGVRFGEMERDSLLSHGAAYLLQDRLFHCSDKTKVYACQKCGSLLSPKIELPKEQGAVTKEWDPIPRCSLCDEEDNVGTLEIPYIFKFLVTQLASVNIKIKLDLSPVGQPRIGQGEK